jgi:Cu(I)/Ag(I) efflux system protein CusF
MNNIIRHLLTAFAITVGGLWPWCSYAQSANDHQHSHAAVQPAQSDGEVKKVDAENAKVTIKHGDIPHLNMPSMTMVFSVKDKALLTGIKSGDKIRFIVIKENGKFLVTDIQVVP